MPKCQNKKNVFSLEIIFVPGPMAQKMSRVTNSFNLVVVNCHYGKMSLEENYQYFVLKYVPPRAGDEQIV